MAIIVLLLFSPCLFNLLVKFVSFRLQGFEVRLMMAQGIQPIPADNLANTWYFPFFFFLILFYSIKTTLAKFRLLWGPTFGFLFGSLNY